MEPWGSAEPRLKIAAVRITFASYVYCTGQSSFEMKTEVDSNDITVYPHDDKPVIKSAG